MLFNSPIFALFFALFLPVFWLIRARWRLAWVLLSSFTFYGYSQPAHLWILLFVIAASFATTRLLAQRTADRRHAARVLTAGIVVCLVPLLYFKYTRFVLGMVEDVAGWLGASLTLSVLTPALPAGISFFTFQAIGYMVDVYRGAFSGGTGLASYASSIAFFPQLVAGPVVRAAQLVPQLEAAPSVDGRSLRYAVLLISAGLAKKVGADLLAPLSQNFLRGNVAGDVASSWVGALAFVAQMYGDFSGYSDMAIGLAGLCGYTIPANFMLPYTATNLVEFWKRWHISLTTWMRDYVFFSLSDNKSQGALYRSLLLTWLVTGIWHGARWNFVYWGLMHGAALAVLHFLRDRDRRARKRRQSSRWRSLLGWVATMWFWTMSLTVFGAPSGKDALVRVWDLYVPGLQAHGGLSLVAAVGVALGLLAPHALDYLIVRKREIALHNFMLWPLTLVLFVFSLIFAQPDVEFIYFEF